MSHKPSPIIDDWPDAARYPRSIRTDFALFVAGLIVVLMAATGFVASDKHASAVTRGLVEKSLAQARSYASAAGKHLLSSNGPDALMLNSICRKLSDESTDIYWSAITDDQHRLVAHTNVRMVTTVDTLPAWSQSDDPGIVRPEEQFVLADDTLRVRVPIVEQQLVIGHLELAASAEPIAAARQQSLLAMASIALGMLLIGLPLTVILSRRKLRPIAVITTHLQDANLTDLAIDIPVRTRNEFGYLADTLRVMGGKVREAQAQEVERERMLKELEIAREIQASILPRAYPQSERFETAGVYRSAREVGGDYFDFITIDEDRMGIVVADVSGKSLPGMLVMLLTRDILREVARAATRPEIVLSRVNAALRQNIKRGMFVTMFYGILNKSSGSIDFSSAGHSPLIHIDGSTGNLKQYQPKGYPLGLMPDEQFDKRVEAASLQLSPGDILAQYSDGINEAQNTAGEEYGMERFEKSLLASRTESAKDLAAAAMQRHEQFVGDAAQYDDITLVTLKWLGSSAERHSTMAEEDVREHQCSF